MTKVIRYIVACCALVALLPLAAQAAEIPATIKGKDVQGVCDVLRGFGTAELKYNDKGVPYISGRMNGVKFLVDFYGCTGKDDKVDVNACTDVMFVAGWSMPQFTVEQANEWNASKRFGKVYVKDKTVFLELAINLNEGGISRSNFEDSVEWWKVIVQQVKKELDKVSAKETPAAPQ